MIIKAVSGFWSHPSNMKIFKMTELKVGSQTKKALVGGELCVLFLCQSLIPQF